MSKDKKIVWVVEYIIGITLLLSVLPSIVHPQPGWSEAHSWAYLLFIACAGAMLLGFASSMRQRIIMSERITKLEQMLEDQKQCKPECGQKQKASEQFAGSVN